MACRYLACQFFRPDIHNRAFGFQMEASLMAAVYKKMDRLYNSGLV
jgi:hypothetical protein